jgi:hypothetical protein
MELSDQHHAPADLHTGKSPGGSQSPSDNRKNSCHYRVASPDRITLGLPIHDTSVDVVTSLWTGRMSSRPLIPGRDNMFLFPQNVPIGCGAKPVSHSMGTGGPFLAVKRQRREGNQTSLSRGEVKNEWSCTSSASI